MERLEELFGRIPSAVGESAKVVLAHVYQMTPPSDREQKKVSITKLARAMANDLREVDSRFKGQTVNNVVLFEILIETSWLVGPPYYMSEDARKSFELNYGDSIK